ncbi:MAG: hypothetical protein JRE24_05175, partial [Deltaproteobacteria bacterium]|nr:hypothetical protein [Deltaproteobacteria bacterium]
MTYKQFLTVRVAGGLLLALVVLWGFWALISTFEKGERSHVVQVEEGELMHEAEEAEAPAHTAVVPSVHEDAHETPHTVPETPHATPGAAAPHEPKTTGVTLVEATISVMDYELNKRFWGWRRNDILR